MAEFAARLWERNMVRTGEYALALLTGFLMVKGYTEEKIAGFRVVWDGRRPNLFWRRLPFCPISSPMCFAHVDLSQLEEGQCLSSAASDMPVFFDPLGQPGELHAYFGLDGTPVEMSKRL